MSSKKDAHLYGIPRPKKSSSNTISSSSSLAFSSQLSSLIAASSSSSATDAKGTTSSGRQRPSKKKEDIFATHNKNSKKRALKDLDDVDFTQRHSTSSAPVNQELWHASKRKMEEKARLYAAMKRGDVEDLDEKFAVDFDRKWAEQQERGEGSGAEMSEDDGGDSEDEEVVEYVDEFGRTRQGTRAEAAREELRKNGQAAGELDRFTARPAMPTNIIYGDTVQADAFNPDAQITAQMAELAAKRDKEATPPPETHFDGKQEIRTKGVGFFHFSTDEETRQKEMAALTAERERTEAARRDRDKKKEERRREVEERRKLIQQKRGKAQADRFLDSLTGELEAKVESAPEPKEKDSP